MLHVIKSCLFSFGIASIFFMQSVEKLHLYQDQCNLNLYKLNSLAKLVIPIYKYY